MLRYLKPHFVLYNANAPRATIRIVITIFHEIISTLCALVSIAYLSSMTPIIGFLFPFPKKSKRIIATPNANKLIANPEIVW
ncbi:Uncharacterised protein, partial [Metamycoplasma alkalescens]